MKRSGLRYGLGLVGVLSVALACGETEKDSDASETGSATTGAGGSVASGSGGGGPSTTSTTGSAVTNGFTANSSATVSGSSESAGSVGGSGGASSASDASVSSSSSGGAGGASGLGGAGGVGGAAGAPPITECLGCERSTEDFGDGCNVWVCLPPGEGMQRLYEAGCMDLGTQVPRYCCPEDVELDCSP